MGQKVVIQSGESAPDPAELRAEIARAKVRQYRIADEVGISESHLSGLLGGRKTLTHALADAIRQAIEKVAAA